MSKILTYIDSGVLITAARGQDVVLRARAVQVLMDAQREFAASVFVKLEVIPKAIWAKNQAEQQLYEAFFRRASHWPEDNDAVLHKPNSKPLHLV